METGDREVRSKRVLIFSVSSDCRYVFVEYAEQDGLTVPTLLIKERYKKGKWQTCGITQAVDATKAQAKLDELKEGLDNGPEQKSTDSIAVAAS